MDLPLLTEADKANIGALVREFEVDYLALTYTASAADVADARDFLDSLGQNQMKVIAKVSFKYRLHYGPSQQYSH